MSDLVYAIELRFARRTDIRSIQRLCSECFPVRYPDSWYADLVSTAKYLTILATLPTRTSTGELESSLVGMIVAEYRTLSSCKVIDRTIIHPRLATKSFVMYILSLGVTSQFRNCGIASLLLSVVLNHAKRQGQGVDMTNASFRCPPSFSQRFPDYQPFPDSENPVGPRLSGHQLDFMNSLAGLFECPLPCRAVYLHTLCTNAVALRFYQRRGFVVHRLVPRCYLIDGGCADGYCCVLYINGGYPYRSMANECLQWLRQTISATRAAAVVMITRLAQACDALSAYFLHSRRSIKRASSRLGLWLRGTGEPPIHSIQKTHHEGIKCDNKPPLLSSK